jgi:hypothetical protein
MSITIRPLDESASAVGMKRVKGLAAKGNVLRPRDIEALLQQAGSMLDTAAAERSEWEGISAAIRAQQRARLDMSVQHKSLQVSNARVTSDLLHGIKEKELTQRALDEADKAVKAQARLVNQLQPSCQHDLAGRQGLIAQLSYLPAFKGDKENENIRQAGTPERPEGDIIKDLVDGVAMSELEMRAMQADYSMASANASWFNAAAAFERIESIVDGLQAEQAKMADKLSEVSEALACSDEDTSATGFVTKMVKRQDAIVTRLSATMNHAQTRLEYADVGIRKLYGRFMDIPPCPAPDDSLDERILWIREVNSQLFSLSRNAQSIVLSAQLIPDQAPGYFLAEVDVPETLKDAFLGTRGISISLASTSNVPSPGEAAVVTPPKWDIDAERPEVLVTRMQPWPATWLPEVFGISSLHNWIVTGRWQVRSQSVLKGAFLHIHAVALRKGQ